MKIRPELEPLAKVLSDLRLKRGSPTYRRMAISAGLSHSTIYSICTGQQYPSWSTLACLATYLRGDLTEIEQLWIDARKTTHRKYPA